MTPSKRNLSLTVGGTLVWGALIALAWKPYLDPLIGFGLRGYIGYVGLHVALAGLIIIPFSRRRLLISSPLIGLALFLALPMPSKPGIDLRITNTLSAPARVTVTARTIQPATSR